MLYNEELIAAKLQKIKENKLSQEIIIPLLQTMGFQRVEFFGGTDEQGKDIIFWKTDEFGQLNLYLAQVKHFKFNKTAASDKSLGQVVNQLTQCLLNPLPYIDKNLYRPSQVMLISTYPIDIAILKTRFGSFPALKDQQITIIDGPHLGRLILQYKPELLKNILGLEFEIAQKLAPTLNNKILLGALGFREEKDIRSIYTDIGFSIGRVSTELFFHSGFNPSNRKIELIANELEKLKNILLAIKTEYDINFLNRLPEDIEEYKPDNYEISKLKNDIISANRKLEKKARISQKAQMEYFERLAVLEEYQNRNSKFIINDHVLGLQGEINKLEIANNEAQRAYILAKAILEKLNNSSTSTTYLIEVDGYKLVTQIIKKREWIESQISGFNITAPGTLQLRDFILRCNSIIKASATIFNNLRFFNCIGVEENKKLRRDFESARLRISIEKLFDTGLNFAVLGDAGAGKTTCLQMYCLTHSERSEKLFFLIPLSGLVQNFADPNNILHTYEESNFEKLILSYLVRLGLDYELPDFLLLLRTRDTVFLFDGIDEAIKPAPWLPRSIELFALRYKEKLQVIVTSRMSGKYLSEIPFFGVTLLPFTPEQRDEFISLWFAKEQDHTAEDRLTRHLSKNADMAKIVTNPLLATTLCVLAKHKLPLPKTEINLYNERVRLLTGHYDHEKKIASRISVTPQVLELTAQKLAFYLHTKNKRSDTIANLQQNIRQIVHHDIDPEIARVAIQELADPCNLLVPMTDDGEFGFDHLRYQEHLAAKELVSDRSIEILPLLKMEWWHGVLILFAGMVKKFEWFLSDVSDAKLTTKHEPVLNKMIAARALIEQSGLSGLLKKYRMLEGTLSFNEEEIIDRDEDEKEKEHNEFEGIEGI